MRSATAARYRLPGPRAMPIVGWRGNLFALHRDPIAYVSAAYQSYGEIAALTADHPSLIFAFGPRYNEQLLEANGCFTGTLEPEALINIGGEREHWRELLVQGDERFAAAYRQAVIELATSMFDRWGIGQQVDVAYVMQRLALRIALRTVFGLQLPADVAAITAVLQQWRRGNITAFASSTVFDLPGTPFHRLRHLAARIAETVAQRIAATQSTDEAVAPDSLLGRARAARPTVSATHDEEGLLHILAAIFVAGYESTASVLTWTLFLLSQHVRVLDDVRAEAMGVNGAISAPNWWERLPLLRRVLKESMRLFPPCSIGLRISTQACELGPYQLPAGAMVLYSPYITHRMPELYFAPRKFRPERWLYLDPTPYTFLPFGSGARTHAGVALAIEECMLILTLLLQRYLLALAPGVSVDRSLRLTLMPKHGLPMIIMPPRRSIVRREAHGNVREMVDL